MLYELMINTLNQDRKYKSFVEYLKKLEELDNIKTNKKIEAHKQLDMYKDNLKDFYNNNVKEFLQYKKMIAYNYVLLLIKFYKYIEPDIVSIEYLNEFRKYAIRVMELALFTQQYRISVNDVFFNKNQNSFYDNLMNIYEIDFNLEDVKIIENENTKIIDNNIKIFSDGIFFNELRQGTHYVSEGKSPYGYINISLASYLRLYTEGVNNVYNSQEVLKKEGGGGGRGQYIDLERLNPYPKKLYYENKIVYHVSEDNSNKRDRYKSIHDNDEELESINKSRKRVLNKNNKIYTIKDTAKKYHELIDDNKFNLNQKSLTDANSYKKFKLNTTIGHLSAKANLILPSKYAVPNIQLLAKFLDEIKEKRTYEYKFLVSSILLGLEPKRIIAMILKLTTELEIVHKNTVRVDLTTAYAQVTNYEIYKKTKNKVEFSIPVFIEEFFNDAEKVLYIFLQNMIIEHKKLLGNDVIEELKACKDTSSLHNFMKNNFQKEVISDICNQLLENQQKAISSYILKKKKSFDKRIVLTAKNLHTFSLHYYKLFHDESDINLLFLQHQTANINTKEAYVACKKKLFTMSIWIDEFMQRLSLNNTKLNKPIQMDSDYSGSNKVVEPKEFKMFLTILMSLDFKNKYANLTLKMIHLRYVFSILLTSRKYYFSANLNKYSRREKLLFLHEKAKNVYNSKRIVPITILGDKYINYFYKLREEFNILSYSPVIIQDDGKVLDFNKENLYGWLDEHKEEIEKICTVEEKKIFVKFLTNIILDFGRHIFSSRAHNDMELSQDYTDAMLNHYEKGTQDQGMYSLFDNQEYFREIRKIMEKIEKEYIPYWSDL